MAVGQEGQKTTPPVTDRVAEVASTDNREAMPVQLALGAAKSVRPCPLSCIRQPATDPRLATVGERDVLSTLGRAMVPEGRLHVDRRRSAALQSGKIPRGATTTMAPEADIVPTRSDFRPAIDPVLAAPVAE